MKLNLLVSALALCLVSCGGDSSDPGSPSPGKDAASKPPVAEEGPHISYTLKLSKIPKGFSLSSPTVTFHKPPAGPEFIVTREGSSHIPLGNETSIKDKFAKLKDGTFIGGRACYELPVPYTVGKHELKATKHNVGVGQTVFSLDSGSSKGRKQTIARTTPGDTVVVDVKKAGCTWRKSSSTGVIYFDIDVEFTATQKLKVYQSDKLGGIWRDDADVVDEVEATLEVKYRGKPQLIPGNYPWLKE